MTTDPLFKDVNAERIGATGPIGEGERQGMPTAKPGSSFQSFMQSNPTPAAANPIGLQSPFDLMPHAQMLATTPTLGTLLNQVKSASSVLGDIQTQLGTPKLKLSQGRKYLLKNKLSEANAHLQAATSKMGAEIKPAANQVDTSGPLGRFVALVTDGQSQLEGAKHQLSAMKEKGDALLPGDLLLIQLKINTAQQNLEFSSMILSNAVNDTKQLLQTQI